MLFLRKDREYLKVMEDRIRLLEIDVTYTIDTEQPNPYKHDWNDVPLKDMVRGIIKHLGIDLRYEPARGAQIGLKSELMEEKNADL